MNLILAGQPQGGENLADLVFADGKKAVTNSLIVAKTFHKRHDNVVRDIEKLDCSESFTHLNFEVSEYLDRSGKANKMYKISRDGFAFLAMGFTGKEAAKFKEAFIAAFNKMEDALKAGFDGKGSLQDRFLKHCNFYANLKKLPTDVLKKANARTMAESGVDVLADYGWVNNPHETVCQFWDYLDTIGLDNINHSRHPHREIAVNLDQFQTKCQQMKLKPIATRDLRLYLHTSTNPKFIRLAIVNSRLAHRSIRCWIFSKDPGGN